MKTPDQVRAKDSVASPRIQILSAEPKSAPISLPKAAIPAIEAAASAAGMTAQEFIMAAVSEKMLRDHQAALSRGTNEQNEAQRPCRYDDAGIYLASQVGYLLGRDADDSSCVMMGLWASVKHHPDYQDVSEAIRQLGYGIDHIYRLASKANDPEEAGDGDLNCCEKWAGVYISLLQQSTVEGLMANLRGLGGILICCADTTKIGAVLIEMEEAFAVLVRFRDGSGLYTAPGEDKPKPLAA